MEGRGGVGIGVGWEPRPGGRRDGWSGNRHRDVSRDQGTNGDQDFLWTTEGNRDWVGVVSQDPIEILDVIRDPEVPGSETKPQCIGRK